MGMGAGNVGDADADALAGMNLGKNPGMNDKAWARAISKLDIENQIAVDGRADVSAQQLKLAGGREPRLMAKIDHRGQLPAPFKRKGGDWGILPTSRRGYVIGQFDMFAPFPDADDSPARPLRMPKDLETVSFGPSLSETAAVNILAAEGALAEFLGENRLIHTIAGRMGTGQFKFDVSVSGPGGGRDLPVTVDRAQIEIDAGFEGENSVVLIEAKREGAENFVIRQLYYPWRHWREKCGKPVRPVYLIVGGTQLRLIEYAFDDPHRYAPPRVVADRRYSLVGGSWETESLADILARTRPEPEPEGVPFPQADRVDRVLEHVGYVAEGLDTADAILDDMDVDSRDIDYYMNAAIYLGFLHKAGRKRWRLSEAGRSLVAERPEDMSFKVAEAILARRVFREVLAMASESNGTAPDRGAVADLLAEVAASPMSGDTLRRRAGTVLSWVRWLRETEAAARG